MLAGFETATHGDISIGGQPINHIAPHKRNIGMVFQNYALFPHMTDSRESSVPAASAGRWSKRSGREANAEGARHGPYGQPSETEGQASYRAVSSNASRSRRALVFEPQLVLMDEPLGALDKQLREEMQYEIKHIHENLGVSPSSTSHTIRAKR